MKIKNVLAGTVASAQALAMSVTLAAAQVGNPPPEPEITALNPEAAGFRITDLGRLIQGLLNMVLFIAALLVFGYMIWGAIQWITSGGDKGKTEEARNKITSAVVGLAVLAASYALFQVVLYFLGISNPFGGVGSLPTAY